MGAEESKGLNYGLMGPSAVVANMNRQAQAARPWSLLHMCSVDQWKSGHAGLLMLVTMTMDQNLLLYSMLLIPCVFVTVHPSFVGGI